MTGQAWPIPAVPLTWPIESEQDRSGNRISYHYFIDGGIEYPYYIDYTECASAPCAFTRSRQIYFNFVLRPPSDYSERWINGARLQRRLRLETIMTLVRDAGDTPREVQRYNISYIQSAVSGRSLIESIQLWYYPHDTTEWLIGRPSRTTHVSSTNGDAYAEGCTTDPCSESSDYTYVPGTRLLRTSTQTHDGQTLITRNTYGAGGLLTLQRLEGSGQTRDTELSYDASGSHIEGVKNPLGHETWSLRNPATGQTFAAVDENGVHTLIVRDGLGRITRVQGQDGSQFDYSYATGQINETSLGGGSASTTFDSRGRPHVRQWSTFDGGSGSTYSEVGQPRLVEYSTGSSYTQLSRTDYDRLGRPVLGVNGLDE